MRLIVVVLACALAGGAEAETTLPTGQPFCTTADNLHQYLNAIVDHDSNGMDKVVGCKMVKGGLRMEIVERGGSTGGMHVDKVRLFGKGGSAVGYTLNIDK